ncbi:MAG: PTS sugar transporter subunit IIA [Verrucomicrobia bacterium]|nr:PTS sugar transporter subunit IIA [Verrucomicrobiota bacterium]
MKLGVRDGFELLEVSDKTVYRWVAERNLPGYRVSGQYRFNRAEVLAWATANKVNVPIAGLQETENEGKPLPTLVQALQDGGIFYRIAGHDVESALRSVVETVRLPDEVDRGFLVQALLAREKLTSTGLGDGIAVPHARNPVVLHVEKPVISLCFLERPVDFGALDGKPVQALFTLISPSVRAHVHLLSRLSFALREARFKALVQEQAGRDELMEAVRRLSGDDVRRAEEVAAHG